MKIINKIFIPLVCSLSLNAFAGSPASVTSAGTPVSWGTDTEIDYHPELGSCATYSNSDMLTLLDTYLSLWDDVADADFTLSQVTGSLPDIDGDNYSTYLYTGSGSQTDQNTTTDGLNPIVFDNDGEIVAAYAGEENVPVILGFAGPTTYEEDSGTITDGLGVINCRCIENHPLYSPCDVDGVTADVTEEEMLSTLVHEFGHFLGLDHSQLNEDAFNSASTDDNDQIPIMYPISFTADTIALTADDETSVGQLYLGLNFNDNHCRVTGAILNDDESEAVQCADIQARATDPVNSISFVSGARGQGEDNNNDGDRVDSGECTSGCGDFFLYLTPGTDYELYITPVNPSFVGGSSLSPCVNSVNEGVAEEHIATISGAACTGGDQLLLGSFASNSNPLASDGNSGSSGSDSGDSGDSGSGGNGYASGDADNPTDYLTCALSPVPLSRYANAARAIAFITFGVLALFARKARRKNKK